MRGKIACGNAKFMLSLTALQQTLQPVLDAAGKQLADVKGVSELSEELRKAFLEAKYEKGEVPKAVPKGR